jgi:hypothetical protein
MWVNGRIAGISGILGGLVAPHAREVAWRLMFVLGLLAAGAVMFAVSPDQMTFDVKRSTATMVLAGLMVGFGTRLGSGCTSGHGVCGLSRLSGRSTASVLTFIATGVATVTAMRWLQGGGV